MTLETTSPQSTIDSSDINLCSSAAQVEVKPLVPQDYTSYLRPPNPSHLHPLPPKPLREPTSHLPSPLPPPPNSDPLTYLHTPSLHRYLANLQDLHGPLAALNQQNLISQQAIRDQQRLILGLEPRSYQAKGKILTVYDYGDDLGGGKKGAAIEVIHAPLGFPNQEVWLWEMSRGRFRGEGVRLREGNVVLFQIVWEAAGNHWKVVDVGG